MLNSGVNYFNERHSPMWYLFQGSIIFAVGASNIYWHWTPNGYLAGAIGIGLAWTLTQLLGSFFAYWKARERWPSRR